MKPWGTFELWPRVPVDRLRPILLRRYSDATEVAVDDLAHRSGVSFRIVKKVLRGRATGDVDFDTTDALLAAAGETTAWLNELADLYGFEEAA
jgi:hypothetical protein